MGSKTKVLVEALINPPPTLPRYLPNEYDHVQRHEIKGGGSARPPSGIPKWSCAPLANKGPLKVRDVRTLWYRSISKLNNCIQNWRSAPPPEYSLFCAPDYNTRTRNWRIHNQGPYVTSLKTVCTFLYHFVNPSLNFCPVARLNLYTSPASLKNAQLYINSHWPRYNQNVYTCMIYTRIYLYIPSR